MLTWNRLCLIIAALSSISHASGSDVILRLQPSAEAAIIARVDANNQAVRQAAPVLDPKTAQQGWKWLECTTTLDGHVRTEQLSKNFEAAPNTAVHIEPNSKAPLLIQIQPTDRIEIIASNSEWTSIRFRKAIPVYFNQQAIPSYTAEQVPGPALQKRVTLNPNVKVANIAPHSLRPENVTWRAAPAGTPTPVLPPKKVPALERAAPSSIMVHSSDQKDSELPQQPKVETNSPLRNLTGILIREISDTGPRYPIRILSQNGDHIAYVDMSQVFISDLRPFLNQTVQIIGEIRPLVPGSQDLIIQARTIRVTE